MAYPYPLEQNDRSFNCFKHGLLNTTKNFCPRKTQTKSKTEPYLNQIAGIRLYFYLVVY